ncbi:hypothetical protein LTR36_004366 [Oleoguttula mirabilis]|uniref:Uncharacterized protein n=1 Tax=Oleoguttula mirabilis TaxID=1507867 RepID=A0AAV9JFR2_9PEZI|nr:hypothetical protein LTR36_004366 [Oleoguttula mirabilis]
MTAASALGILGAALPAAVSEPAIGDMTELVERQGELARSYLEFIALDPCTPKECTGKCNDKYTMSGECEIGVNLVV